MLYTRNVTSDNILKRVDLGLVTENPNDIQLLLYSFAMVMNYTENLSEPIVVDMETAYGFCEIPNDYTIECNTPRIAVLVKGSKTPINFVWYNNDDTQITAQCVAEKDSVVFLQVQGTKLVYDGKILRLKCPNNISKGRKINAYFVDLYGLPQAISLHLGSYTFGYETNGSFRAYNGQMSYELGKNVTYNVNVGEQGYTTDMRKFINGFVASIGYYGENPYTKNQFDIVVNEITSNNDRYDDTISVSGTMQVGIADIDKIEE